MLKRQTCDRRRVGSFCLLHSTGGFITTVTVGMGVKISCARDVLFQWIAEGCRMKLDVENKTWKVETCIVDLLIKVAENHQFGMPNS